MTIIRRFNGPRVPYLATLLTAILVQSTTVGWPASISAQELAMVQATDPDLHLLRRATFGVRPADVTIVKELGRDAWLDRQLYPERLDDSGLAARLGVFPAASKTIGELVRDYTQPRPPRPQSGDSMMAQPTPEQRRMRAAMSPNRILVDMVGAKLVRSVWSERQLEEVMTDFWFNHFNVFFQKGLDRYLVGDFEREAIRPYVFGRFEDMLRATAQHPAMLFYLDNWTSSSPDTMAALRAQAQRQRQLDRLRSLTPRQRDQAIRNGRITREQFERADQAADIQAPQRRVGGLNENYARELMELHTLGVDGGYSQDDVVNVARAFTGWSLVPPLNGANAQNQRPTPDRLRGQAGEFVFRGEVHDGDEKVVLGHVLPAGRGMEDGLDVIHILATHPSTATFIATKLIERFVSDTPDPAFVEELAAVFRETDGDLRAVTRALFTSPRFYDEANIGAKVKTPFELVASALRVTYAEIGPSPRLMEVLRGFGHLPYGESAPTGYPAASEDWVNSGAMLNRMNFALELASGQMRGIRPDGARLRRQGPGMDGLAELIDRLMPGLRTDALESAIRADLTEQAEIGTTPARILGVRAVGLTLGSPGFQRR